MEDEDFFEDPDYKSKSKIKAEVHELKALGLSIAELPEAKLNTLAVSSGFRAAIDDYRRITHKNARKRQASFIGKLMRHEDVDQLKEALDNMKEAQHRKTRQLHLAEQWRDRLLNEPEALQRLIEQFSTADRQQLRSLIRSATKERQANKTSSSARKLFRYIQELLDSSHEVL